MTNTISEISRLGSYRPAEGSSSHRRPYLARRSSEPFAATRTGERVRGSRQIEQPAKPAMPSLGRSRAPYLAGDPSVDPRLPPEAFLKPQLDRDLSLRGDRANASGGTPNSARRRRAIISPTLRRISLPQKPAGGRHSFAGAGRGATWQRPTPAQPSTSRYLSSNHAPMGCAGRPSEPVWSRDCFKVG